MIDRYPQHMIYEKNMETVTANELRRIMKRFRLNQVELAVEIGVTQATVSRWLNGRMGMSWPMSKHVRQVAQELLERAS